MIRRTTIEIDGELLDRAKRALGESTMRGAVEEALRRATQAAETEQARVADRQRRYFQELGARADMSVLASEQMWR